LRISRQAFGPYSVVSSVPEGARDKTSYRLPGGSPADVGLHTDSPTIGVVALTLSFKCAGLKNARRRPTAKEGTAERAPRSQLSFAALLLEKIAGVDGDPRRSLRHIAIGAKRILID